MSLYKRISSKSFSSFTNFCQYCSKPLDESLAEDNSSHYISNAEISSINNPGNINHHSNSLFDPKFNMENIELGITGGEISIFYCGHSFHLSCLDILETVPDSMCPLCNSSSFGFQTKGIKSPTRKSGDLNQTKKMKLKHHQKQKASLGSIDLNSKELPVSIKDVRNILNESQSIDNSSLDSLNQSKHSISLSESQITALKSIRIRKSLNIPTKAISNSKYNTVDTLIEKHSKLQLAPANLTKLIE